jgi:hypothetical protein
MHTLPAELLPLIVEFQPLFSKSVWENAQTLLVGAILAIGKRTVTACLRVTGKSEEMLFQNYHRVLNRARWSAIEAARVLLRMLVNAFAISGELVIGLDDTIERRRGAKIKAKGIYRDPVRSSQSHFVKASGLRWLCSMLLVEIPWAGCVWGLPFLTVLCPSERYYTERKRRHQRLTDRAWQVIQLITRWLPHRNLIFLGDGSFAVLDLLYLVSSTPGIDLITRLRLDAQLYDPAPKRKAGQTGRPRVKGARRPSPQQVLNNRRTKWTRLEIENWYGGKRREIEIYTETSVWYCCRYLPVPIRWVLIRDPQGEFEPQALVSTNLDHTPTQILRWFVRRWRMEVTFEEARAHTGIETQRQWNDLAIARTTPALFGLFSMITLMADQLIKAEVKPVRTAAWYEKQTPTFADAIAIVRRCLWSSCHFSTSGKNSDVVKVPRSLLERLTDAVCYAA